VLTFTLPKLRLVGLALTAAVEPVNCSAKVSVTPFALAVSVTASAVLTAVTVAVKLPLVAPAATCTVAGTVTALLLLARFTVDPPLAAATLRVTEQLSFAAPDSDPLPQVTPVSTGTPVPLRLTAVEPPADELLVRVSDPVTDPAAVGSNCTVSVAV